MSAIVYDFISERVRRGVKPKINMVDAARAWPDKTHKFMIDNRVMTRNKVREFLLSLESTKIS